MNFDDRFEDINSSSKDDNPLRFSAPKTNEENEAYDFSMFLPGGDSSHKDDVVTEGEPIVSPTKSNVVSLNRYAKDSARQKAKVKLMAFNIVVSTLLILSMLSTFAMGVVAYYTGGGLYQKITTDKEELGITQEAIDNLPKGVINIALFGVDSRSKVTENRTKPLSGRSDTIIILSVDRDNNTVKMVSIMRDSWVDVDGKMRKINTAYARGGPQLAIKTLNQNFGLNITDYVAVSIHQLWKVIDLVCDVEGSKIKIHITEREREHLNLISEREGLGVAELKKSGYVELDGGQAMVYARIRKIDGDNVRVMRQQKILNCLFEKAKNIPLSKYPDLLKEVIKNVETSLSYDEIFKFAPLLAGGSLSLDSVSLPNDEVKGTGKIFEDTGGAWVWKFDLYEAKAFIYKYLYGIE